MPINITLGFTVVLTWKRVFSSHASVENEIPGIDPPASSDLRPLLTVWKFGFSKIQARPKTVPRRDRIVVIVMITYIVRLSEINQYYSVVPRYRSSFMNCCTVCVQTDCFGLAVETKRARPSRGDWKKVEKRVLRNMAGWRTRQMLSVEFSARTSKNVYTPITSATHWTDVSRGTKIENDVRINLKIVVCST